MRVETLVTTRMKSSPSKMKLSKKRAREEQGDVRQSSSRPASPDPKKAWKKSQLKAEDILSWVNIAAS
jgi:hypothetical protein